MAVSALVVVGLYFVLALEASTEARAAAVVRLCLLLLAAFVAVLALVPLREFFALVVWASGRSSRRSGA